MSPAQVDAAAVRRIRERRGETQLQYAQHLGVKENTVWRWEHEHPISDAYRRLIAASDPGPRRRSRPAAARPPAA